MSMVKSLPTGNTVENLQSSCFGFFVFTIRSGSGTFSAMTWDLLRLQSLILNLLVRVSLSSLRGRSSTLAPDEALRSKSGSRMDLSGGGGKDWEAGVSGCKLVYRGWINNKVLLDKHRKFYSVSIMKKTMKKNIYDV